MQPRSRSLFILMPNLERTRSPWRWLMPSRTLRGTKAVSCKAATKICAWLFPVCIQCICIQTCEDCSCRFDKTMSFISLRKRKSSSSVLEIISCEAVLELFHSLPGRPAKFLWGSEIELLLPATSVCSLSLSHNIVSDRKQFLQNKCRKLNLH